VLHFGQHAVAVDKTQHISQTYKSILSKRVEDSVQKDTDKADESIKWHFIKHPEA